MKIVILTRTGFHHTSFINRLQQRFDVACVVREAYPETGRARLPGTIAGALYRGEGIQGVREEVFLWRFRKRYSAGFRFHPDLKDYLKAPFANVAEKPATQYMNVPCGDVNSERFASFLQALRPDLVAVLGSSVLKSRIISIPSVAMINLHSGLSPYYRGTWSYGWPIVNGEPQYIGATVHHVNAGIDTGDIICQTRPRLDDTDDLNAIFLKVISEGIELVADTIEHIRTTGWIDSCPQPRRGGRHYRTSDLTAYSARRCLRNLGMGTIGGYLANKKEIDSRTVLYGLVPPKIFI